MSKAFENLTAKQLTNRIPGFIAKAEKQGLTAQDGFFFWIRWVNRNRTRCTRQKQPLT